MAPPQEPARTRLFELALLFGRLGSTAFGGPAAHIAMMEDEVVRRRRWLTREEFLDCVGATNLIPGPNSTELAMHIGHAHGGWRGLVVAGVSFIAPATLIVAAIAWAYVEYGSLPDLAGLLYGVKPVVIALVVQALWSLGRLALKTSLLVAIGVLSLTAIGAGVHELAVLAAAGLAMAILATLPRGGARVSILAALGATGSVGSKAAIAATLAATAPATAVTQWTLFLTFTKIGAVLFGSGYVLLAFLRTDFVERLGWLTEPQLLDAIAVGQLTPGPVLTAATFVGYLVARPLGAIIATVGIFLPAFGFVALSRPWLDRMRSSRPTRAILDGVNAASLALMAAVSWQLGRMTLVDLPTVLIAICSLVALVRYRVNSAWLVAAGGFVGWLV